MSALRLFVALPAPEEAVEALRALQRAVPEARWSPAENFHITLRFIGDTDPRTAEDVDAELGRIACAPFALSLGAADSFGGAEPHSLHVRASGGAALDVLQGRCERACRAAGLAPDPRAWRPHLTLAYLPRHADVARVRAWEAAHALFASGPWTADRFHLYSSHLGRGPSRYTIEAEYPLTG